MVARYRHRVAHRPCRPLRRPASLRRARTGRGRGTLIGCYAGSAECGLPDDAFVFACFNNPYKITQEVFDVWMRLLQTVPRSILWLLGANSWQERNLRREALSRGVAPERLTFGARIPSPEQLVRSGRADRPPGPSRQAMPRRR
ncbi:MAG TPA: hypothetical protein VN823_25285 [Stellaceae bacterium]|nr:hypothetical protein [Stellaceae bacterium]